MNDRQYPTNTANTLYIREGSTLSIGELVARVKDHFGEDITFSEISIRADEIQEKCFSYDLYDGDDWGDYLIIERIGC